VIESQTAGLFSFKYAARRYGSLIRSQSLASRFSRTLHVFLGSLVLLAVLFSGPTIDTPDVRADLRYKDKIVSDLNCLALNVYWEARSEPYEGQLAVAAVTLNRVRHEAFPDDVCSVVRQGGERPRHRCQFSWWCDGKKDEPTDEQAWKQALLVAWSSLLMRAGDPTGGALHYHADYVAPKWRQSLVRTVKIGRHIYYRQPAPAATPIDRFAQRRRIG